MASFSIRPHARPLPPFGIRESGGFSPDCRLPCVNLALDLVWLRCQIILAPRAMRVLGPRCLMRVGGERCPRDSFYRQGGWRCAHGHERALIERVAQSRECYRLEKGWTPPPGSHLPRLPCGHVRVLSAVVPRMPAGDAWGGSGALLSLVKPLAREASNQSAAVRRHQGGWDNGPSDV